MTDFQQGETAMARSCLAALSLIRAGRWSIADAEEWLNAVIQNDARYVDGVKKLFAAAMNAADKPDNQ